MFSGVKNKLKVLVLKPFILALFPSIILILLIPLDLNKYIIRIESNTRLKEKSYVWFDDLDHDGSSEQIMAFDYMNSAGISVNNDLNKIDQWNVKGTFNFSIKDNLFITGDCNNDGIKEIYLFSIQSDSILLHCISPLQEPSVVISNRFIAKTGPGIKNPDPFIIRAEPDDLDGDGFKEIIFGITTGFSKFPRSIYAYYVSKDSLVVSPESSCFLENILQEDINGDGKREIIPFGYSTRNISPEEAKYHDYSSWFMVLDHNLKFQFEPIEFNGNFNRLTPIVFTNKSDTIITALSYSPEKDKASILYTINKSGEICSEIIMDPKVIKGFITLNNKAEPAIVLMDPGKDFYIFDKNLKLIKTDEMPGSANFYQIDIDHDSKKEIILRAYEIDKLFIYREGLTDPAELDFQWEDFGNELISVKNTVGGDPVLSVQVGNKLYFIQYGKNPRYYWNFGIYLSVYLAVLAFVSIIMNLQKKTLMRKYETEKQISELQLSLLRNQLDPHFMLNAINSVIYSVKHNQSEKAAENLHRFANLYRSLLLSGSSTRRTLMEEIKFTEDYLMLEKMRFKDRFDFEISISNEVEPELLVPKMLIQVYTENAVKHGLNTIKGNGRISISVYRENEYLVIKVEDNGVGRVYSANHNSGSTGKGLMLMEEYFRVFSQHFNQHISAQIDDLLHENGSAIGTLVIIRIENAKN
ncbi:MAG: histidine kinase [Bacteroidales bacterium]